MPQESLKQTLVGGTHTEVGLKLQLSPRGLVSKKEELKFLLLAAPTTESHLCRQIPKFRTCETSKSASASAAEPGLALAAL